MKLLPQLLRLVKGMFGRAVRGQWTLADTGTATALLAVPCAALIVLCRTVQAMM